jgi:hypothetical protein
MNKSSINTSNPSMPLTYQRGNVIHVIHHSKQQAGRAHHQAVRPHKWLNALCAFFMLALVAGLINVIVINALFFPDCNRTNNDCFLIQKLWGAK